MDGRPALLRLHAFLGDIAERADADEEFRAVRARQQAARPMAAGLEIHELAPRRGDARRARRIGEGDDAIGIADIESVAQQRHAEGLVQPFQEHFPDFGHAIAIRVAQQRDAVRADAHGGGAFHRADHRIVEDRSRGSGRRRSASATSTSPLGSTSIQRGCCESRCEGVDFEPGRGDRRLPCGPSLGGRHFQRRDAALRLGRRDRRRAAPGLRWRARRLPPRDERSTADHRDDARKKI